MRGYLRQFWVRVFWVRVLFFQGLFLAALVPQLTYASGYSFENLMRIKGSTVAYGTVYGRLVIASKDWKTNSEWIKTTTLTSSTGATPGSMIPADLEAFIMDDKQVLIGTAGGVTILIPSTIAVGDISARVLTTPQRDIFVLIIDRFNNSLARVVGISQKGKVHEVVLDNYRQSIQRPPLEEIVTALETNGYWRIQKDFPALFGRVPPTKFQMRGPTENSKPEMRDSIVYPDGERQLAPQDSWGPNIAKHLLPPPASPLTTTTTVSAPTGSQSPKLLPATVLAGVNLEGFGVPHNTYEIAHLTDPTTGEDVSYYVQARIDGALWIVREDGVGFTFEHEILSADLDRGRAKSPPSGFWKFAGSTRTLTFQRDDLTVLIYVDKNKLLIRKGETETQSVTLIAKSDGIIDPRLKCEKTLSQDPTL